MDNFIIRWYNQNRKIIWIVILTFVAVISLIRILDNHYKNNPKVSSSIVGTTTYNEPNYAVVTQQKIDEKTSKKSINLIDQFFDYCNAGQIESAYNLLSLQCKKELYPTIEDFKTNYYNKIFTEQKSYSSTLWVNNSKAHTYRIEITTDLLATGQKEDMAIEEYYSIIFEDEEYKLNINRFIGKEIINKSKYQDKITVNVLSKKIYIDYEIYEIEVRNNTGNKIIFNTKEDLNSIYIQDENELKHIAFLHEMTDSELEILNGIPKTLQIKFNRKYKPTIKIQKIVFRNINNNGRIQDMEIEL